MPDTPGKRQRREVKARKRSAKDERRSARQMRSEDPAYASVYDQTYRLTEDAAERDDADLPMNTPDDGSEGDVVTHDGSPDAGTP
jgi:hypothetical protein